MIGNDIIQGDFIMKMKTATTITSLLVSAEDIKEDQYQGTDFNFPAIRFALMQQTPLPAGSPCDHAKCNFAVRCYSEEASSKQVDQLATAVNDFLHGYNIQGATWYGWVTNTSLVGASRATERLWRSEVVCECSVYPRTNP
jgi:hypothetical protein